MSSSCFIDLLFFNHRQIIDTFLWKQFFAIVFCASSIYSGYEELDGMVAYHGTISFEMRYLLVVHLLTFGWFFLPLIQRFRQTPL
jgi:hypothetical protein